MATGGVPASDLSPLLQDVSLSEGETSFSVPLPSDEQALALFPNYSRLLFSYGQGQEDIDNDVLIKLDAPKTMQKLQSLRFVITDLTVDKGSQLVRATYNKKGRFTRLIQWKADVRSAIEKGGIDLLSWEVVRTGLNVERIQQMSSRFPDVHFEINEDHLVMLLCSKNQESLRKAKTDAEKEAKNFEDWLGDFKTSSNISVILVHGDITGVSTEAIVSAVGAKMQGGGVGKVISQHAGEKMQQECKEYVKKHDQLKVTEVAATSGEPRWKKVIHAHGPHWRGDLDTANCRKLLAKTTYNCLKKAAELNLKSIALPFLSSGECQKNVFYLTGVYCQIMAPSRLLVGFNCVPEIIHVYLCH